MPRLVSRGTSWNRYAVIIFIPSYWDEFQASKRQTELIQRRHMPLETVYISQQKWSFLVHFLSFFSTTTPPQVQRMVGIITRICCWYNQGSTFLHWKSEILTIFYFMIFCDVAEQEATKAQICLSCVCIFFNSFSKLPFLRLFCRDTRDRCQHSSCTSGPTVILVQFLLVLGCLSSLNPLLKQWRTPQTFSSKPAQERSLFFWRTSPLGYSQLKFRGQPSACGNGVCYSGAQHTERFLILTSVVRGVGRIR